MNNITSTLFDELAISSDRIFTREKVDSLLSAVRGKTLEEVDVKGVLNEAVRVRPDKVVRGIAGDVIEVSVLGCKRDSRPEPDIWVDNIKTELKTTGLIKPKKGEKSEYEAKEPLTITGVSPEILRNEVFENSRFYHKIEHLLFVFYHYSLSSTARNSGDYCSFPILGHLFWDIAEEHLDTLRNDWKLVQDFVKKFEFSNEEERHKLKQDLMLIDYSSPNQPRFRFKRAFVSTIVDIFLQQRKLDTLTHKITKFSDIDAKCRQFTEMHRGKTAKELADEFGIKLNGKDSCQRLVIKMFGSNAKSINLIRDFSEIGLTAKTITLTSEGKKTEDMKLFMIDFEEWCNPTTTFDEQEESQDSEYSEAYSYFAEQSFLFIIFEEPFKGKNIPLEQCKFKGFKRYTFKEDFIKNDVRKTWEEVRRLVFTKELKEIKSGRGYAPNFPKVKHNLFFVRGSGETSADKKHHLSNWGIEINMYAQYAWLKGEYIVSQLDEIDYL